MKEFAKDLVVTIIGSLVTVGLETAVEVLKEKASRKAGKHSKRP